MVAVVSECLIVKLTADCLRLQAYLWDNNRVAVEWLEKHLTKEDGVRSGIRENIKYLKRENTLKRIRRYVNTLRHTVRPIGDTMVESQPLHRPEEHHTTADSWRHPKSLITNDLKGTSNNNNNVYF